MDGNLSRQPQRAYRRGLAVPTWSDVALCAYVTRLGPREHRGVALPRKLGRVDLIHDIHADLEDPVAARNGGGRFVARAFEMRDKRAYVGTYEFAVAGDPLLDGEPVAAPQAPKPKPKSAEVVEIERLIAREEELMRKDELRAARAAGRAPATGRRRAAPDPTARRHQLPR